MRYLVTGGTGSFGRAFVRRVLDGRRHFMKALVVGDVAIVNPCDIHAHLGGLPRAGQIDHHHFVTALDQVLDARCADATGTARDHTDA